ncbi:MAG: MFS transporter, partial [Chloroflexota bacterium]|nr:MFS transporter [Chloroflexota bacterium]
VLYRRRRAQWLMYLAIGLQAASATLFALPTDTLMLGVFRGMQGFAFGMASTVNMALFLDCLPSAGNRHRHLAAYASAMSLGFTFGGLGGGLLGDWLGYAPTFLCAGAVTLLAVPCVTRPARAAERPSQAGAPLSGLDRVRSIATGLRHPLVLGVSLVAFFLQVVHHMGHVFVPLYALHVGLSLAAIGVLRSTHALVNTLARPFGGELTRRFGYNRVTVVGMALISALLMVTPFTDSLVGLLVLFTGIGLGRAAVLVANTVSMADIQQGGLPRGVVVGVYSAARDLGGIVGPIAGGYIAAAVGLRAFFWVGPPLTFALFGLLFWYTTRAAEVAPPTALASERREEQAGQHS